MSAPKKTSTLAVVALVFACLCFPVGMILGVVALVQIGNAKKRGEELGGHGIALAAVIISGAAIPIIGIMAAIAIPSFVRFENRSKSAEARANLRMLSTMQESYFADHERYLAARPNRGELGKQQMALDVDPCSPDCAGDNPSACTSLACLNFEPFGSVRYLYACETTPAGDAYTCAALGDVDGDGELGLFVFGSGDGALKAPIPDFGGRAPPCPGAIGGELVDCTKDVF